MELKVFSRVAVVSAEDRTWTNAGPHKDLLLGGRGLASEEGLDGQPCGGVRRRSPTRAACALVEQCGCRVVGISAEDHHDKC